MGIAIGPSSVHSFSVHSFNFERPLPVSVGHDGQIPILPLDDDANAASSSPISVVTGHRAPISAMALVVGAGRGRGEEGRAVYTADTDGIVVEWDGRSGRARGRVVPVADDDVGGGWLGRGWLRG